MTEFAWVDRAEVRRVVIALEYRNLVVCKSNGSGHLAEMLLLTRNCAGQYEVHWRNG